MSARPRRRKEEVEGGLLRFELWEGEEMVGSKEGR
jgi:hypothetical protein